MAIYKYGPIEPRRPRYPRVVMYGPTEPYFPYEPFDDEPVIKYGLIPPFQKPKPGPCSDEELGAVIDDYLNFLAVLEDANINSVEMDKLISDLKANLRILKIRLMAALSAG